MTFITTMVYGITAVALFMRWIMSKFAWQLGPLAM